MWWLEGMADQLKVSLRLFGDVSHPAGWRERRAHPDYDLWVCRSGRIHIRSGQEEVTLLPGDMYVFFPGHPYTAWCSEGCRFVYLHFWVSVGGREDALSGEPLQGCFRGEDFQAARDQMMEAVDSEAMMAGLQLRGAFMILLAALLRAGYARPETYGNRSGAGRLAAVLDRMHQRPSEPATIQELAGLAGVSEKYFISLFRQQLGLPPHQYQMQVRIQRAREILATGTTSVRDTAELMGFPDAATFSKAFRKVAGRPPGTYR